jgi:D-alanyl-D-alanine carboxypeptidase
MQSGLYPYTSNEKFIDEVYRNPQVQLRPEQLLAYSFSQPLVFPPGTSWLYDNTNYVLMGLVVEKLSGQPLRDYLRDHIFRPFGLRNTIFPVGSEFPVPHAHGYTINAVTGKPVDSTDWNPSWAWAAGAMISKLSDLRRWAPIVATGKGLLTPRTQAERLQTVHPPGAPPDVAYGLGILVNAGWIGHNGSLPGYESVTLYLPAERTTLVILINTDNLAGPNQREPSTILGEAITSIATPGHVYGK